MHPNWLSEANAKSWGAEWPISFPSEILHFACVFLYFFETQNQKLTHLDDLVFSKTLIICRRDSNDEIEIYNDSRAGYNDANYHLNMNLDTAEDTSSGRLDLLSNGFTADSSDSK